MQERPIKIKGRRNKRRQNNLTVALKLCGILLGIISGLAIFMYLYTRLFHQDTKNSTGTELQTITPSEGLAFFINFIGPLGWLVQGRNQTQPLQLNHSNLTSQATNTSQASLNSTSEDEDLPVLWEPGPEHNQNLLLADYETTKHIAELKQSIVEMKTLIKQGENITSFTDFFEYYEKFARTLTVATRKVFENNIQHGEILAELIRFHIEQTIGHSGIGPSCILQKHYVGKILVRKLQEITEDKIVDADYIDGQLDDLIKTYPGIATPLPFPSDSSMTAYDLGEIDVSLKELENDLEVQTVLFKSDELVLRFVQNTLYKLPWNSPNVIRYGMTRTDKGWTVAYLAYGLDGKLELLPLIFENGEALYGTSIPNWGVNITEIVFNNSILRTTPHYRSHKTWKKYIYKTSPGLIIGTFFAVAYTTLRKHWFIKSNTAKYNHIIMLKHQKFVLAQIKSLIAVFSTGAAKITAQKALSGSCLSIKKDNLKLSNEFITSFDLQKFEQEKLDLFLEVCFETMKELLKYGTEPEKEKNVIVFNILKAPFDKRFWQDLIVDYKRLLTDNLLKLKNPTVQSENKVPDKDSIVTELNSLEKIIAVLSGNLITEAEALSESDSEGFDTATISQQIRIVDRLAALKTVLNAKNKAIDELRKKMEIDSAYMPTALEMSELKDTELVFTKLRKLKLAIEHFDSLLQSSNVVFSAAAATTEQKKSKQENTKLEVPLTSSIKPQKNSIAMPVSKKTASAAATAVSLSKSSTPKDEIEIIPKNLYILNSILGHPLPDTENPALYKNYPNLRGDIRTLTFHSNLLENSLKAISAATDIRQAAKKSIFLCVLKITELLPHVLTQLIYHGLRGWLNADKQPRESYMKNMREFIVAYKELRNSFMHKNCIISLDLTTKWLFDLCEHIHKEASIIIASLDSKKAMLLRNKYVINKDLFNETQVLQNQEMTASLIEDAIIKQVEELLELHKQFTTANYTPDQDEWKIYSAAMIYSIQMIGAALQEYRKYQTNYEELITQLVSIFPPSSNINLKSTNTNTTEINKELAKLASPLIIKQGFPHVNPRTNTTTPRLYWSTQFEEWRTWNHRKGPSKGIAAQDELDMDIGQINQAVTMLKLYKSYLTCKQIPLQPQ